MGILKKLGPYKILWKWVLGIFIWLWFAYIFICFAWCSSLSIGLRHEVLEKTWGLRAEDLRINSGSCTFLTVRAPEPRSLSCKVGIMRVFAHLSESLRWSREENGEGQAICILVLLTSTIKYWDSGVDTEQIFGEGKRKIPKHFVH